MKHIHLTFGQRIIVWMALGPYPAPHVKEAAALSEIYKQIRPTDEEMRDSEFVIEAGRMHWNPQYVADRDLEIEDEEGKIFAPVLESIEPMRVLDAVWIVPLIKSLKGELQAQAQVEVEVAQ